MTDSFNLSTWSNLTSIIDWFKERNFPIDRRNNTNEATISLSSSRNIHLLIIQINDSDYQSIFHRLTTTTNYILIFNGTGKFWFISNNDTNPSSSKPRICILEDGTESSLFKKVDELKYNQPYTFDELFNTSHLVKMFYDQYTKILSELNNNISNITDDNDRRRYSEILVYRTMFLYFIQKQKILDGDQHFLIENLKIILDNKMNFYDDFLKDLFFNVLNTELSERNAKMNSYSGIPYLNGGLFRKHEIEQKYENIAIKNTAFEKLLEFLSSWIWYVDDSVEIGKSNSINPEILGHIFEKSINNQKSKGAYYTPTDVSTFITKNAIEQFCIVKMNKITNNNFKTINDIFKNKKHTEIFYFDVLKNIHVLDNACGSGEFILASSKILYGLYDKSWSCIENMRSSKILQESKEINKIKKSFYFKHRIITQNLFGVDIEEGAIEICRLRMWLSLVEDMKSGIEPLPNIDYNLMVGNSLIGYVTLPSAVQQCMDDDLEINRLLTQLESSKEEFRMNKSSDSSLLIKNRIEMFKDKCSMGLNRSRVTDLSTKNTSTKKLSVSQLQKMNPFHWILDFNTIIQNDGGFDVIVGNPPWVSTKLDYPTEFLVTHKTGDTSAYFLETSLKLLNQNGVVGYVIPMSTMTNASMKPLQNLLLEKCRELRISFYDLRPSQVFSGVILRVSILFGTKKNDNDNKNIKTNVLTTKYYRWYSHQRKALFENVKYSKHRNLSYDGSIPKIGSAVELSIFKKIKKQSQLNEYIRPTGYPVWYYNSPFYWTRAHNTPPYYSINGNDGTSDQIKRINFQTNEYALIIEAIFNSSLFLWYYTKTSDCRHLNKREIEHFGIDLKCMNKNNSNKLINLVQKLRKCYTKNSRIVTSVRQNGNTTKYREFYVNKCKHVIDEIDKVLANHYKLTDDELRLILNFDLDVRTSIKNLKNK